MNKLIVALGSVMGLHGLVLASNVPTQPTQIVPEDKSLLGEIGYGPGVLDANEWKRQWEEPDDALAQTAYAKNMKALTSLPTVEEAEEMDPEACKKVLLELCSRIKKPNSSGDFIKESLVPGLHEPNDCKYCDSFAETVANRDAGELMTGYFRLMHPAYIQASAYLSKSSNRVMALSSHFIGMLEQQKKEWEKEKERRGELMKVARRYQYQLQEPTQDQPPSTDKTPVSLPEDFLTLQGKYFQELSMWCKCISDSDQNAIKALGELMAIQPQYINLKRCNDDYEKQLLQESDSRRTGADDLEKETLGTHKPKGKSGDGEAEAAENPKNLTG